MFKKGIIVSTIFVFSTLVQLISQIIVTRLFGATFDLDVFLAAVALPMTIVTVIYGTLNDALLPILGEKKIHDSRHLNSFFSSTLLFFSIITALASIVFWLFSYPIAQLFYQSRGEIFVKNVSIQMTFMSLSFPLSVIATFFGSFFYIHKRYFKFPLAQLVGSIANVLIIVLLVSKFAIWSLVIAFVVNIFIQILFVLPPLNLRELINWKLIKSWKLEIRNLLFSWFPLMIGYFALKNDTLIVRSFGSNLPVGSLVYLNLIFRIFSLATSVVTIGFQIVLLPQLIEDFNGKNYKKAFVDVRYTKIITVLISVAITIITVVLTPLLLKLLFVGGRFTSADASKSLALIPFFILPAIGWGINNIFFQPLIALKKQKELGILNVCAFGLAWTIGSFSKLHFGPMIALSAGLITLLFTGIIGSEILWQHYKKGLLSIKR